MIMKVGMPPPHHNTQYCNQLLKITSEFRVHACVVSSVAISPRWRWDDHSLWWRRDRSRCKTFAGGKNDCEMWNVLSIQDVEVQMNHDAIRFGTLCYAELMHIVTNKLTMSWNLNTRSHTHATLRICVHANKKIDLKLRLCTYQFQIRQVSGCL